MIVCPNCGSNTEEDSVFCPECGFKVNENLKTKNVSKQTSEKKKIRFVNKR